METPAQPESVSEPAAAAAEPLEEGFVPVCQPEELPKGVCVMLKLGTFHASRQRVRALACGPAGTRKEVRVGGVSVLLFWYRQQIYAIESRCAHRVCWPAARSQAGKEQSRNSTAVYCFAGRRRKAHTARAS